MMITRTTAEIIASVLTSPGHSRVLARMDTLSQRLEMILVSIPMSVFLAIPILGITLTVLVPILLPASTLVMTFKSTIILNNN